MKPEDTKDANFGIGEAGSTSETKADRSAEQQLADVIGIESLKTSHKRALEVGKQLSELDPEVAFAVLLLDVDPCYQKPVAASTSS
ncbi:MAG: hypothetical protein AAGB04_00110 [Pseudomonadota bacterium]